jgi:hypothetical protein
MLISICLIFIGIKLQMEWWYYTLIGITLFFQACNAFIQVYKLGLKDRE